MTGKAMTNENISGFSTHRRSEAAFDAEPISTPDPELERTNTPCENRAQRELRIHQLKQDQETLTQACALRVERDDAGFRFGGGRPGVGLLTLVRGLSRWAQAISAVEALNRSL